MKEKDIIKDTIKEAVRCEWDKLVSFEKYLECNAKETEEQRIRWLALDELCEEQRIRWLALDELWRTLYDEEY